MNVNNMINDMFPDFSVIAGKSGLNRQVKTVNVIDAPGIQDWLTGGEFLITTGYLLKEDPYQMKDLIEKINNNGAAALGIKLKRFIDKLPDEVLDIANELNFPIISIPHKYSFSDIINPLLSELVNKQTKSLLYSQNIHKSFTELSIKGEGIEEIISTLAEIINTDIIYFDTYFEKVHKSKNSDRLYEKVIRSELDELLYYFDHYPIKIDSKVYGYVILNSKKDNKDLDEYVQIALEHSGTVLKLDIQKRISNQQIEKRHRDEFIQDLILNNIHSVDEMKNRAKLYKWNIEKGTTVMVVDIDSHLVKYKQLIHGNNQKK